MTKSIPQSPKRITNGQLITDATRAFKQCYPDRADALMEALIAALGHAEPFYVRSTGKIHAAYNNWRNNVVALCGDDASGWERLSIAQAVRHGRNMCRVCDNVVGSQGLSK